MDKEEIRGMVQAEIKDRDREEIRATVQILMDQGWDLVRTIIKVPEVEQALDLARLAIRDLEVEQVLDLLRTVLRLEMVGLECTVCLPQENCLEVAVLRVQEDLLGGFKVYSVLAMSVLHCKTSLRTSLLCQIS
jgi:hypothetical protein